MKYVSKVIGSVFAFSVLLFLPQVASADQTASLLPINDGNYLQWTPKTGTTHFSQVDETTCDGLTSYNSTTTTGNRDSYGISLSSIPDGATITQLDITPCASRSSAGGTNPVMNVFYRINNANRSPNDYHYRIRAFLGGSNSDYSNTADATVLIAPSSLSASVVSGSTDVNLSWNDNSSNEDGFQIERSDNGGAFLQINTVGPNVTTYTDPGLATGSFIYRVRAYKSANTSSYTNTAGVTIP